jgi:hypothetical protein
MTSQGSVMPAITPDDLAVAARTRVFFGHQSVGMNVLGGVAGVYAGHDIPPPAIEQDGSQVGQDGGLVRHAYIGENGKPLVKIRDFDVRMRSGVGDEVDVAMMKFCYVDVTDDTDVSALFAAYRETLASLERDFPKVTFVHVTVPLMTEQGLLSMLKSRLAGTMGNGPAANVARERLNTLIRQECTGRPLFDLAAVESTAPDGGRAAGTYQGQQYFRLYGGYASDSGHLNDAGARVAASAWLKTLAQVSPR